ncbi:hypothetical protein [Natrarchaeobius halalkaliphilus]|uniref:hypothetical protein n=1 Tax=Natrarchaeobius halalkaliphilus TaxID=1679091 RepID=UPI001404F215|nr:hypothetical protein [Natrarchaeobius halalkaliphilus]
MNQSRGVRDQRQAEEIVIEFLERELVSEPVADEVSVHLACDEPFQALETILDDR